jgi:hypothetical protein
MIADLRYKNPFIHFGFYAQAKTITLGQSCKVWLSTLYHPDVYSMVLVTTSPKVIVSPAEYTLTPIAAGEYEIYMQVERKVAVGGATMESNRITLIVE